MLKMSTFTDLPICKAGTERVNKCVSRRAGGWCVMYEKGLGKDDVVTKLLWVIFHLLILRTGCVCRRFVAQVNPILKARSPERKTRD